MTLLKEAIEIAKRNKIDNSVQKEIIEKIYAGYLEEDKDRQKKAFAPSGLFYGSGACARRWVISFKNGWYEQKATPLNIATMRSGTAAHERIQSAMLKTGIATEVEIPVQLDSPPINGFADAKIVHDKTYLCEIKTTKQQNFDYRKNTNKIADYHLAQMLFYMYILEINDGIILYESKDSHEIHAIIFEMTPEYREWVEQSLEWCRRVWGAYEKGEVPKRSFRVGSRVCQSCPVEKRCLEMEDGIEKFERLSLPE